MQRAAFIPYGAETSVYSIFERISDFYSILFIYFIDVIFVERIAVSASV